MRVLSLLSIYFFLLSACSSEPLLEDEDQSAVIRLLDDTAFLDSVSAQMKADSRINDRVLKGYVPSEDRRYALYNLPPKCLSAFNSDDSQNPAVLKVEGTELPLKKNIADLVNSESGWIYGDSRMAVQFQDLSIRHTYTYNFEILNELENVNILFSRPVEDGELTIAIDGKKLKRASVTAKSSIQFSPQYFVSGVHTLEITTTLLKSDLTFKGVYIGSRSTILVKSGDNKHFDASTLTTLSFNAARPDLVRLIKRIQNAEFFYFIDSFPVASPLILPIWQAGIELQAVRRSFILFANRNLEYTCTVPEGGASLNLSLGYFEGIQPPLSNLSIEIQDVDDNDNRWQSSISTLPFGRMTWYDNSISLDAFAGRSIKVTIRYEIPVLNNAERSYIIVGEPVILTRQAKATKKNVILISLDTFRYERLSASGWMRKTTPFLDSLAKSGQSFSKAYSTTSWTLPSHKTMLTGFHGLYLHYLENTNSFRSSLVNSVPTLATYFRKAGYYTFGLANDGYVSPKYGFARDFDIYYNDTNAWGDKLLIDGEERVVKKLSFGPAIQWLQSNGRRGPFFMFLHTYNPHIPYSSVGYEHCWLGETDRQDFPKDIHRELRTKGNEDQVDHINKVYDRNLRRTDEALRLFFDELERMDLLKDTLIVITSDHGELLGEDNVLGGHRRLRHHALHVPLIFLNADINEKKLKLPFSLESIAPTIMDLADLPVPDYFSTYETNLSEQSSLFSCYFLTEHRELAIVKDEFKYMITTAKRGKLYRYNHSTGEQTIVKPHNDEQRELARAMKHELFLRFAEEIPGWNVYLPNSAGKRLRVRITDAPVTVPVNSNAMNFELDETIVTINHPQIESGGSALLFCYDPSDQEEHQLIIEEFDEANDAWIQFDEQLLFSGSKPVSADAIKIVTDEYPRTPVDVLVSGILDDNPVFWFTNKPFRSSSASGETSLSDKDLKNLQNLGYLN